MCAQKLTFRVMAWTCTRLVNPRANIWKASLKNTNMNIPLDVCTKTSIEGYVMPMYSLDTYTMAHLKRINDKYNCWYSIRHVHFFKNDFHKTRICVTRRERVLSCPPIFPHEYRQFCKITHPTRIRHPTPGPQSSSSSSSSSSSKQQQQQKQQQQRSPNHLLSA